MQHLLKRPGYRLHSPDSPEARVLLAEQVLIGLVGQSRL
jgi:hypothetical protein